MLLVNFKKYNQKEAYYILTLLRTLYSLSVASRMIVRTLYK